MVATASACAAVVVIAIAVATQGVAADANCTTAALPYAGNVVQYALFDKWLIQGPAAQTTAACQNQDPFFDNNDDRFASVNYAPFQNGAACGACINVTSSTGYSEVLTVIDSTNNVNPGDILVSSSTGKRLGGDGTTISFAFVKCAVQGTIKYRFSVGATASNSPSIGFSNFVVGISAVAVTGAGSGYTMLQRMSNSVDWNMPSGSIALPMKVQITSVGNEQLTFTVPSVPSDGAVRDAGVQFQGTCTDPPATSPPAANAKGNPGAVAAPAILALVVGAIAMMLHLA